MNNDLASINTHRLADGNPPLDRFVRGWEDSEGEGAISAYLHIPFCRRRCFYCDFAVSVVGDRKQGENSGTISRYVEALCREIEITVPTSDRPLETVFLGGGTPSLLSVRQLDRILTGLDRQFGIAADAEISMEMDPGTFDRDRLQGYSQAGVNRVSLGVQAFRDDFLQACGRSHTVADIHQAIETLHGVGMANFSIDLISGLPHQTLDSWKAGLDEAIAIAPHHISVYDLSVEPGTPFDRYYEAGEPPLPTDEMTAQMYRLARQILAEAGYDRYEISNYARSGYQCRHNLTYWKNRPYYGLGMGATSYLGGRRLARPRTRWDYYDWLERAIGNDGTIEAAVTPIDEQFLETLMLGLRLREGIDLGELFRRFGISRRDRLAKSLQPYWQQGWIEVSSAGKSPMPTAPTLVLPQTGRLRLSDPEGFLFSNTILSALFRDFGD
jgi:oxygen-independent coproporphyrinogen-3 oxidase